MGWSPYQCCQGMMVLDEKIGGNRLDKSNFFRWDYVQLNLPGSPRYTPSLPWVSKVRTEDGKIAAERLFFMDDGRSTGNGRDEVWAAAQKIGSMCIYHGIQDSSRKQQQVSQEPGAWVGTVVWVRKDEVLLLVSDDKWSKTQAQISKLALLLKEGKSMLPR
jgi:hypothetical protein